MIFLLDTLIVIVRIFQLGSDWKGPFIRIEGVFHSPRFVTVINSENNDERKDTQKKRGLHDAEHR